MTHKIKVQMFGNFRMDYNGAPFVAEKMHKESQFNRMMQALIHYSDCGIAKDKLEEIVIGERDIDAPHTALRVIVYKTKQKLAQLGLPGKNLIYLEGGIYYWTPDIEIEEDAAEFEKLYNEACALEKQMPQESESAETVCDERIKEIEDNMLELYVKALYLYKGEFLVAYTGETWIAQEARRYHTMFEKIINEAAYILRKRKQFKGLEKIGVYAAKVDPFNEWEELIMEAMVETRRYDEAEELYTDVVDYYLRECGIYPSSRLLEILEKYSNQMNHAHEILENIQEGMNEQEETERGGYFCSYPVFKGIYQASIRIMKRTRVPVYLIEAKEKVEISQEYRTVASVTFQNLFMMFDKMAGMSGTLMDAKDELFETYGKHVVKIPTNRPLKRVDRKDRYFKNGHDQFWTAVDDVIRLHETGQPVLVVLNSVTDTDLFSRLLIEKNIPHNVLNASNAFWEAQIIAGAGQLNAVTVATTMAGRGTDIKLGDGVKELGGLAVIGIGRMNNSRSERQARGRAGRQGDPGFSQYYVSLEDDIVGAEDDDKLQRYIDGKKRIGKRKIKRIVNQCQKLSVESEEMNRKKSLQYDQVLQRQRDLIYATRKNLLDGASVEQEKIVEIAKENISDFVNNFDCIQSNKKHGRRRGRKKDNDKNTNTEQYTSILNRYILDNISYKLDAGLTLSDMQSAATVSDYLMLRVYQGLSRQRERIGDEEAYEQFVREATLKAVDDGWVELIDYLEQLKYAVAGRASAQRNVMFEYQNEAFESFLDTEKAVKCNIIRNILLSDVKIGKDGRLQVIYP